MASLLRVTSRASLVASILLVGGCSMAKQVETVDGPGFTLSAETPVMAFEVTLCLTGPSPDELYIDGRVGAEFTTTAGRAIPVLLESLEAPISEDGEFNQYNRTFDVESEETSNASVSLVADGEWKAGGRRCSAPEVIQFSVESLESGETVDVAAWDVTMSASWSDGAFGDGPKGSDLSVTIAPL
ncbi:MAG: hypothetical protein KUG77_10610 [Nannocystaceae bacterium]|nr:hypothetical protein [Nannocystaceae bacterium]